MKTLLGLCSPRFAMALPHPFLCLVCKLLRRNAHFPARGTYWVVSNLSDRSLAERQTCQSPSVVMMDRKAKLGVNENVAIEGDSDEDDFAVEVSSYKAKAHPREIGVACTLEFASDDV